ncbi:cold shock domain-containing protein [Olivibacter sp. CPCC 100613]|uniref:cold-shock protein n=1 Tax=Olivibacter sp. CPCC 100613 TaxID=3079931 RepID=UPI002FF620CF
MQKGVAKFFKESGGFGFITPQSGEKEIFVHISELIDEIHENDEVTFEVTHGTKGLSAVQVKIA